MPFRPTVVWLDRRETFELTEVKLNVPIDATKFAKLDVTASYLLPHSVTINCIAYNGQLYLTSVIRHERGQEA